MIDSLKNEIWLDIKGYEGYYRVSNMGSIFSIHDNKLMKQQTSHKGYFYIVYCVNQVKKAIVTHRLVAKHFIPNPENKPQVNHIDGVKKNNNVSNLEWCTAQENTLHGMKMGLINPSRIGEENNFSRFTEKDVLEMRMMRENGYLLKDISIIFNTSDSTISNICSRRTWKHI